MKRLAAGVWRADIARVHKVAGELRAGTVWTEPKAIWLSLR